MALTAELEYENDFAGSTGSPGPENFKESSPKLTVKNQEEIEEKRFRLKTIQVEKANEFTERKHQKDMRLAAGKAALR